MCFLHPWFPSFLDIKPKGDTTLLGTAASLDNTADVTLHNEPECHYQRGSPATQELALSAAATSQWPAVTKERFALLTWEVQDPITYSSNPALLASKAKRRVAKEQEVKVFSRFPPKNHLEMERVK